MLYDLREVFPKTFEFVSISHKVYTKKNIIQFYDEARALAVACKLTLKTQCGSFLASD